MRPAPEAPAAAARAQVARERLAVARADERDARGADVEDRAQERLDLAELARVLRAHAAGRVLDAELAQEAQRRRWRRRAAEQPRRSGRVVRAAAAVGAVGGAVGGAALPQLEHAACPALAGELPQLRGALVARVPP